MNEKSEQLKNDLSLEVAQDQPLRKKAIVQAIRTALGVDNCSEKEIAGKRFWFIKTLKDEK